MKAMDVFDMRHELRHIAKVVETGMGTVEEAAQLRQFAEQLRELQMQLNRREERW